ncbi:MAG: NAD(P)H-dependent oxidoreductase [Bacteroidota bacterium]|nr:NAD(P)H-dependent oxidoreductase [Bacteroidota bacterium]
MKPIDENAALPVDARPFRILIIAGSARRQFNCPGIDGKARMLMMKMADMLPTEWEIDYEDLANAYGREKIQSCNACVSTSMALCVWPCNCYEKNSRAEPDFMWNADLYSRLDMADAWAIIGPVNWYAPSSNLKLMFDRIVCMNGGNPDEKLIDHKDPEKAMAVEHTELWKTLSLNHLEGRTAAFFCYGDQGGDEMDENNIPKILQHKNYFDGSKEPFEDMRQAYAPLVWQCRYGGVEVPEQLWEYADSGVGMKYSDNQAEDVVNNQIYMGKFENWVKEFETFVSAKGKVTPGKYRAYGFKQPPHLWNEIKTGLRAFKLRFGKAPSGSSNAKQIALNLNRDATFNPKKTEGEKLRKK